MKNNHFTKLSSILFCTFAMLLLLGVDSSVSLELGSKLDPSSPLLTGPLTELPFEH